MNSLAIVFSMVYDFLKGTVQSKNNIKREKKTEKKFRNAVVCKPKTMNNF
jgi:hypothetical protein